MASAKKFLFRICSFHAKCEIIVHQGSSSKHRTSRDFKWSKVIQISDGPLFRDHLKSRLFSPDFKRFWPQFYVDSFGMSGIQIPTVYYGVHCLTEEKYSYLHPYTTTHIKDGL